jgi:D-beta-D-heptose 7-phosphate kinase/D-beta-D-heptose 1-phosphate adenosyltransferase
MSKEKIIDRSKIKKIISDLKSSGKKIVFTNGCFDLIHVGHVRYLNEAKTLGDVLVIGLNADASVSSIKPGRPVNNENERAEVLAALEAVDYVVLFSEDTPYELIKAVQPDLLVKGADWKKEDIVGNDLVKEVRTIRFVEGISTSGIIEKIRKLKDDRL